jgi:pimeloyl-ACP methyl ester carboxylesterase
MDHGMANIEPGLRLHFVAAGDGDFTAVLLHGFPQTWQEWRHVIQPVSEAGFRIIAPDYRGAGNSSRPLGGYDKLTMANDIRYVGRDHLGLSGQLVLIGHDIGLMVAYAYAQAYREEISHLVVVDAPVPGTAVFDRLRTDPRVWHFAFHGVRDIPEMLVAGRERPYLQAFFGGRLYNASAFDTTELEIYVTAYVAPGAMRAGFELYRAFDRDIQDNRAVLAERGKLTVPVLAVGGAYSTSGPFMAEMMREVAEDVTELRVANSAHWIPEENPADFLEGVLTFLGRRS